MTKVQTPVGPLVDVSIPRPGNDLVQIKLARPAIFFIGFVPRRPENERQRTVSPNDIQIVRRETLLAPIARGSNDGLMFADHCLEILDHFQRHVIFLVTEIHERAGVSAMFGNHNLNGTIGIDGGNRRTLVASSECQTRCNCYNNDCKHCIPAHSARKFCANVASVQHALSLLYSRAAIFCFSSSLSACIKSKRSSLWFASPFSLERQRL